MPSQVLPIPLTVECAFLIDSMGRLSPNKCMKKRDELERKEGKRK